MENLGLSIKSTSPLVACRFCIERVIECPRRKGERASNHRRHGALAAAAAAMVMAAAAAVVVVVVVV